MKLELVVGGRAGAGLLPPCVQVCVVRASPGVDGRGSSGYLAWPGQVGIGSDRIGAGPTWRLLWQR